MKRLETRDQMIFNAAGGPTAAAISGPKVHPAVAALPPALGTAPLPDGMVRMYHQTDPDNIPSIEKHGLLWDKGTGVEGPKGVWVADKPFYGLTRNLATIEVAIPKADREIMGHIASIGDIPTSRILTINMEWHDKVREFVGSNYERSLWAGEYDQLLDDPNLAKDTGVIALRYMRDNGIGKPDFEKSNPNHGKYGRFTTGGGSVRIVPPKQEHLYAKRFRRVLKRYGEERAFSEGTNWYPNAFKVCQNISDEFNGAVSPERVAAVIAVTSPQVEWATNVNKAKAIISYFLKHGADFVTNPVAETNEQGEWTSGPWGRGPMKKHPVGPTLLFDDPTIKLKNSSNLRAAFNVLTADESNFAQYVTGPKVTEFFKAMTGDPDAITVDVIIARAAGFASLGDVGDLARGEIQNAIRRVAKENGQSPRDTQAAIWLATERQRTMNPLHEEMGSEMGSFEIGFQ